MKNDPSSGPALVRGYGAEKLGRSGKGAAGGGWGRRYIGGNCVFQPRGRIPHKYRALALPIALEGRRRGRKRKFGGSGGGGREASGGRSRRRTCCIFARNGLARGEAGGGRRVVLWNAPSLHDRSPATAAPVEESNRARSVFVVSLERHVRVPCWALKREMRLRKFRSPPARRTSMCKATPFVIPSIPF